MVKTKDKLYDTADTMKPYVDRALHDDDLHDNLKEAFKAARDVYSELLGNRNLTSTAMRVGRTRRSRRACARQSKSCAPLRTGSRARRITARATRCSCSPGSPPASSSTR